MTAPHRFNGLIAAAFTPMHDDGSLYLERVPEIVSHLQTQGLAGAFVGGSTGEGPSLSARERVELAESYVEAAGGEASLPVGIVHVEVLRAEHLQRMLSDDVPFERRASVIGARVGFGSRCPERHRHGVEQVPLRELRAGAARCRAPRAPCT